MWTPVPYSEILLEKLFISWKIRGLINKSLKEKMNDNEMIFKIDI